MDLAGHSICLNMIVRNEAPVIRRCLASVLPIIDYWAIVDTGSSDGSQKIIRGCLKHVPGQLVQRPWVDFGHNRTEALTLARGHGTYVLVIDADEVLKIADGFDKKGLNADSYFVEIEYGNTSYVRKQLLRNSLPWRFTGVLHEHAICEESKAEEIVKGLRIAAHHDGARARDPQTYRRDAIILETALLQEPHNARYAFYLAQSYRDARELDLALRGYKRRAQMNGWRDETWFSLYQIARLCEHMEYPWNEVMHAYLSAYQFEPNRAEPLYRIGRHYRQTGEVNLAHLFLSKAIGLRRPPLQSLFVEKDVYEHLLPLEFAASCAYSEKEEEAIAVCNRLLSSGALPPEQRDPVLEIREASVRKRFSPSGSRSDSGCLRICICLRDPGSELDDCVESLLLQRPIASDITFLDDGSQVSQMDRITILSSQASLIRYEKAIGPDACMDRFVNEHCGDDDVVVVVPWSNRLASPGVVQTIRRIFENESYELAYGQYRVSSGVLGDAEPAASEQDFLHRLGVLARHSLLMFRSRLWKQAYSSLNPTIPSSNDVSDGRGGLSTAMVAALLKASGFSRTCFSDDVFTWAEIAASDGPAAELPGAKVTSTSNNAAVTATRRRSRQQLPTVSCLMVTRDRVALAKRSIRCYSLQTYKDRELVIVTDGDVRARHALERFVSELKLEHVHFVYPDAVGLTLGQLRNIALDSANGPIVCQWDDDDCYHPERIRLQVEQMLRQKGQACCLTDHLHFLEEDRALVWVDWTLGGRSAKDQLLPGTIVMFKDSRFRYPESGPLSSRGEDSMLLYQIYDTASVAAVKGMGYLYLYTYHGRNTFDRDHHYRLARFSRAIADLKDEKEIISKAMGYYHVPKPYLVVGRDGPAFLLND